MVRLKSIGVLSLAKMSALLHAGISLLFFPFFLLIGMIAMLAPRQANQPSPLFFAAFAVVAPFLYGAMGFVLGALAGFIYNLVAGWIGGVELHFENPAPPVPASVTTAPIPPPGASI